MRREKEGHTHSLDGWLNKQEKSLQNGKITFSSSKDCTPERERESWNDQNKHHINVDTSHTHKFNVYIRN